MFDTPSKLTILLNLKVLAQINTSSSTLRPRQAYDGDASYQNLGKLLVKKRSEDQQATPPEPEVMIFVCTAQMVATFIQNGREKIRFGTQINSPLHSVLVDFCRPGQIISHYLDRIYQSTEKIWRQHHSNVTRK